MSTIAPVIYALPLLSRMARAALNWSQEDACQRMGIPKTTLARFETSTGGMSSIQSAELIAIYEAEGINFNSGNDGSVSLMIDKVLLNPERAWLRTRRSDYKGIRPINAPFNEEELACMDEIERKLKEAYSK